MVVIKISLWQSGSMPAYRGVRKASEVDGLARMLIEKNAVLFGKFTLTSGKESDMYVDIKKAYTYPEVLQRIGTGIASLVKTPLIAGVELGAIPLIAAASVIGNIPFVMIRKEREHGTKEIVVGPDVSGKEVTIVEDVITTGGSVVKAAEILRSRGAKVSSVICVVDREEGGQQTLSSNNLKLRSLIKLSDIMVS
jgi:orotate phosphoribosyltransferase